MILHVFPLFMADKRAIKNESLLSPSISLMSLNPFTRHFNLFINWIMHFTLQDHTRNWEKYKILLAYFNYLVAFITLIQINWKTSCWKGKKESKFLQLGSAILSTTWAFTEIIECYHDKNYHWLVKLEKKHHYWCVNGSIITRTKS